MKIQVQPEVTLRMNSVWEQQELNIQNKIVGQNTFAEMAKRIFTKNNVEQILL